MDLKKAASRKRALNVDDGTRLLVIVVPVKVWAQAPSRAHVSSDRAVGRDVAEAIRGKARVGNDLEHRVMTRIEEVLVQSSSARVQSVDRGLRPVPAHAAHLIRHNVPLV
jgi:hypothetical protein